MRMARSLFYLFSITMLIVSGEATGQSPTSGTERTYRIDRVGQSQIVQLYADGFEKLSLNEKIFSYYLTQAAIAGRDIAISQRHPLALEVRELLQGIYLHPEGIDPVVKAAIVDYLKLFWENNGWYDHLTSQKFSPGCTAEQFSKAVEKAKKNGATISLAAGESIREKLQRLLPVIFDPLIQPKLTNKAPGEDWIKTSAVNFYDDALTLGEVETWSKAGREKYPLNSTVVKSNGTITEQVWRAGGEGVEPGLYARELSSVIKYLELAVPYASGEHQAQTVRLLIRLLRTGDPADFRAFNIQWVQDNSRVDFILGFIEVYLDPRGQKGEFEASVFFTDPVQTAMMQNIAKFAQYFEDKAPWADIYKKKIDKSPIANVINVIVETGGCGPLSPIGVNLPNDQAIREQYGSKSVLLHNVVEAYDKSTGKDLLKEFAWDEEEIENQIEYGSKADNLHTALHEVIGHGSGKTSSKLNGKDPSDCLPGYYSTLEETRADLVALWNAWDSKLVDIGIAGDTHEVRKIGETMYQQTMRAALNQLRRVGTSTQYEEDHMKNRALIANYLLSSPSAARIEHREGKAYYRIVNFEKAREVVGTLLAEVMRIKAEGDLAAAKHLVDTYGLHIDVALRDQVQERVSTLDTPSYTAFAMPRLVLRNDDQGSITDVTLAYDLDFPRQMMEYSNFSKKESHATH